MKKVLKYVFWGVFLIGFSGLALAEDVAVSTSTAAGETQYELEDVVITGTKTQLKIKDSPAAVSIVTKENLDAKNNVINIDDALTTLPGVQVARTQKGNQSIVLTLRGLPDYTKSLVLLDGFSIQNPNNARPFWNQVPVDLVERVEVVRGPFSSLYGKYAIGGVVNIITKEPQGRSFNFKSAYDSTNIRTTAINFSDRPIEKFAYFVGFENSSADGYTSYQYIQKNATTGTATVKVDGFQETTDSKGKPQYIIGESPRTQVENNNYTGKLYYLPAPGQTISLLYNYSKWDQPTNRALIGKTYLRDHTTGAPIASGTVELYGTGKTITVAQKDFFRSPGQNGIWSTSLNYKGKINEIVGLSAGAQFKNGPLKRAGGTIASNATIFSGTGTTTSNVPNNTEKVINVQSDLTLDKHRLIIGVTYDNSLNTSDVTQYDFWGDFDIDKATVLYENQKVEEILGGVFVQDEWKILSPLTAFIGVRYDNWTIKDGKVRNISLGQDVFYDPRNQDIVSPKISLVYKPVEEASIRVSAGRAFNPPAEIALFTYSLSATSESFGNPELRPEIDDAWEIGGEYTFSTKTTVSGTYFANYLKDLIYTASVINNNFTTSRYVNAGKAEIKGFETEVKQPITESLSSFANYTFIDGKVIENLAVPASVGKQIPDIAKHTGNVGLNFAWKKFNAALTETFASKRYRLADNSDTVNGVQGSYDPYAVANIRISYAFTGGKVSFGVENITDLKYYTNYKTTGRSFNLGVNFNIL